MSPYQPAYVGEIGQIRSHEPHAMPAGVTSDMQFWNGIPQSLSFLGADGTLARQIGQLSKEELVKEGNKRR
jgi:hypothetical protein